MKFINLSVIVASTVLLAIIAASSIYLATVPDTSVFSSSTSLDFGENKSPLLSQNSQPSARVHLLYGETYDNQILPVSDQPPAVSMVVPSQPTSSTVSGRPSSSASPINSETLTRNMEPLQNRSSFVESTDFSELSTAIQHRSDAGSRNINFLHDSTTMAEMKKSVSGEITKKEASLPLAMQELDVAALGLGAAQVDLLATLRDTFVKDIGGENQNPDDSAYAKRWSHAQPRNDANVRLFFGSELANKMQLQAAQAAYAATQGSGVR